MKRIILYSVVSSILVMVLLFRFGFFYINVSPNNTYWLNETEKSLISTAILRFRERVENGKFNEIQKEFADNERDINWQNINIERIKDARFKFGKPLSWEFFRSAQPHLVSEHSNKSDKYYSVEYLIKAENGEFLEDFTWIIKGDSEIRLLSYSGENYTDAMKWRLEEQDKQKLIVEKYPNEIIIPYADRYIEIRY